MDNNSSQSTCLPSCADFAKRVACIRCRTQKLKCIKSTNSLDSASCDRCRKADVVCTYVPSKPMGRPKMSRSRQASRTTRCATTRPNEILDDLIDLNTIGEDSGEALGMRNMTMLFDDDIPRYNSSDASTTQDFAFSAHEMDFLTPCSSQGTSAVFSSEPYLTGVLIEDESAVDRAMSADSAGNSDQSTRSSMESLAKIGLNLHEQTTRYQKYGNDIAIQDLVGDVIRSSTEYLDCLLSLDDAFVSSQSGGFENTWANGHSYQTTQQLDMSAAFQLLIPYVRLVQLHNILYRSMLRYLSGNDKSSGSGSGSGPSDLPSLRSNIPTLTVGGTRINAGGPFRAQLLLHINVNLLAEIESALELPLEARICCPQAESGMGTNSDMSLINTQGTCGGPLHKAVSPRLLRTILEERNIGIDGIQAMRDCITRIRCLARPARHRPL